MINNFLRKQHIVIFITIFYSLIVFISYVFFQLEELLNIGDIIFSTPPSVNKDSVLELVIIGLIVSPLVETLVFQSLIYNIFGKTLYFNNKFLICILSGLLFGLSHFYSLYYIIKTIIIGFVLMYAFMVHIKNIKKSFWIVVAIHFLLNLSVLTEEVILLS